MRQSRKKTCFESWYFREQAVDFACTFTVRIDYDEEGRMTGHLDVELPCGVWHFDYAHPVNMNLRDSLFLVLGRSVFTEACVHLDIDVAELSIKGDIYFDREWCRARIGLKRKIWAMEQALSGELIVNGKTIVFDGGKGYLEERSGMLTGPQSDGAVSHGPALWTQCNWFGERPFRIVCGSNGKRCFAMIDQDGYPIRLRWWKGAKMEYMSESRFRMVQGRYVLEGWHAEGEEAAVRYRLTRGGDVLFDEISRRATYEYKKERIN